MIARFLAALALLTTSTRSNALLIDRIEDADNPSTLLVNALVKPSGGVTVLPDSANFIGRIGNPASPNSAQSATFTGFNLLHLHGGKNIQIDDGIFLTTGIANIPTTTNNFVNFSFVRFLFSSLTAPGTGRDPQLEAVLSAAGLLPPGLPPDFPTNDRNVLEFSFTTEPAAKSVRADFVFGSEEFPDQAVTDVFGFFVDGANYAVFPDGSLVSFVIGKNADNFNDNPQRNLRNYDIEYDGLSNKLTIAGLLNPNLTTHTLRIAIADTHDTFFNSGVFISSLRTDQGATGGILIPEPTTIALAALLAAHLASRRNRPQ